MTEILDAPPHVCAVRISGRSGDADSETIREALDAVVAAHDEAALYVEIGWVHGISAERFAEDTRAGLAELVERGDVARAAIVADAYARRSVLRAEAARASAGLLHVFPPADHAAALAWAADGTKPQAYVA